MAYRKPIRKIRFRKPKDEPNFNFEEDSKNLPEIEYKIEFVTPAQALVWLNKNEGNRKKDVKFIRQLARNILNGTYKLTHQPIAFDRNGNLVDGQHRLEALLKAYEWSKQTLKGVYMTVAYGVERNSMDVIDSGKKRHFKDHMKIRGIPYTSKHGSIAGIILGPGLTTKESLSTPETEALISAHIDSFDFVLGKLKFKAPSVVGAVLIRAAEVHPERREDIARFADVYMTGRPENRQEWAAVTLKQYIKEKTKYGTSDRIKFYVATEMCLLNFFAKKPLKQIKINEEYVEKFPLKGEVAAVYKVSKSLRDEYRPKKNIYEL